MTCAFFPTDSLVKLIDLEKWKKGTTVRQVERRTNKFRFQIPFDTIIRDPFK